MSIINNVDSFASRLTQVQERIARAADRSGRSPSEITLVAVSKRQSIEAIQEAYAAGLADFGENYVQEVQEKIASPSDCRWHMLGHLQSNKVRVAVGTFDLIQSVDSVKLAFKISQASVALGKTQKILIQVHLGNEETKSGFPPELVMEAADEMRQMPGVSLLGLMGIASQTANVRPQFRAMYNLFDALPASAKVVLSMGMTGDFEAGIEEGATMVRIGTALFGARH